MSEEWIDQGAFFQNREDHVKAVECFDKALQKEPHNAHAWHKKGISLRKLERYEEAIEAIDRVIQIDPSNADFWRNRGVPKITWASMLRHWNLRIRRSP